MSTLIQIILCCTAGLIGIIVVLKLLSKRDPDGQNITSSQANGHHGIDDPMPCQNGKSVLEPTQSARDAFLYNVDKFGSILPQLNNSLNIEYWTEQIVDINNPQLTALWQHCLKNITVWKQMLSSWGLRQDTCKSFTYLDKYANMYETADGYDPEVDCKYRVIDGCWILTDDNTGNKRVIKKGIIEKL